MVSKMKKAKKFIKKNWRLLTLTTSAIILLEYRQIAYNPYLYLWMFLALGWIGSLEGRSDEHNTETKNDNHVKK